MTQNIEAINQWFKRVGKIIVKLRWLIILIVVVMNAFAFIGVQKIQFDTSNENWFLADDPLTIAKNEFEEVFGNNDYASVLVEAEDVFAPDILKLIREIGEELEEQVPYADEVVSLADFEFTQGTEEGMEIEEIVPDEIPTDLQAIEDIRKLAFSKPFLVNRLFSDDSKQAWIMLRLNPYPDDWEAAREKNPEMRVGQTVLEIVNQKKYQQYTIKASGSPVINYQDREFFSREANRLIMTSFLIAILVLFAFLRTLRGILIPMLTFFSAVLWVFGAMGWLSITIDNLVMTLPIFLGLALSIGYSIHLFNFFHRSFFATGKRKTSVFYAIEETGWPIFFTAATTIGALCSFYFVPIRQVRWMGLSSAAVVITTYLLIMTLTPALLSFGKNRKRAEISRFHADFTPKDHNRIGRIEVGFTRFSQWILNHPKPIIIMFIIIVFIFLGGLTRVYISMEYVKTYGLNIPFVKMLHYVGHTKIGAIYSYDLTLTFDEQDTVKAPGILKNFDLLISEAQEFELTKRVSSLLDVIKDMNQVVHGNDLVYYRIPDDKELVAQLLLLYEMSDGTEQENWVDYEYTTLRLMVEITDYKAAEIEKEFRYLEKRAQELFPDAKVGIIGMVAQFATVQNYIAKGEIVSFSIALVVIAILMMLVFRSLKTGLIGMIPNLAPVFVVGGLMGYFGIPLDMTSMVIIPILLGLAVDDTIHFISHTQLELLRSGNYRTATHSTFRTVGKAIFMTSFILIAAFAVYMTSIAAFFIHLGGLMTAGVLSALLADYFITPILVNWLKPFGKQERSKEPYRMDKTEIQPGNLG